MTGVPCSTDSSNARFEAGAQLSRVAEEDDFMVRRCERPTVARFDYSEKAKGALAPFDIHANVM